MICHSQGGLHSLSALATHSFQSKLDALLVAEAPIRNLMPLIIKLMHDEDLSGEGYYAKIHMLSGSVSEGAMMARCFQVGVVLAVSFTSYQYYQLILTAH